MTLKQRILFFFEKDKNEKLTNKEREPYIDSRVFTGTEIKKYLKEEALKVCKIEIHCKRQDSCSIIKDVAGHPFSVLEKAKALQKEIWTKEA